jgi:tetraacyldisaccharide 4'-kinase
MDDGLQNPTLRKDISLMVIDGGFGFGNGRVLPAGPLRETISACAARCHAAVLIGTDECGAAAALPPALPVLRARLVPGQATESLCGRRVLAFAGIGRPTKFFATLREAGAELAGEIAYPDHHPFTDHEIGYHLAQAARLDAIPVTTAKDAVRLPKTLRDSMFVADVSLAWQSPDAIDSILDRALASRNAT